MFNIYGEVGKMNNTVAAKIKEIRTMKGLTQKQLADKMGIGETLIQKYEFGTRNPKMSRLKEIAHALGVDVDVLMPSQFNDPYKILSLLYNLIEEYGELVFDKASDSTLFSVSTSSDKGLYFNLTINEAMDFYNNHSIDEFKEWLLNVKYDSGLPRSKILNVFNDKMTAVGEG